MKQAKKVKNEYIINKIVNTKRYHDKFKKLPFSKKVREVLYDCSLEILNQRNGTALKTAYAIDARTGSCIVSSSTEVPFKSSFSKSEFLSIIANLNSVIFIHNHPSGGIVLYRNMKCSSIIVIGYNSDVYVSIKNEKIKLSEIGMFYNHFVGIYDKVAA